MVIGGDESELSRSLRVKTSIVTGGRRSSVALAVIVVLSCGHVLRVPRDPESGVCVIVWSGVFQRRCSVVSRDVFKNSQSTPCVQHSTSSHLARDKFYFLREC